MTSPVSLPAGSRITAADLDAYEAATSAWQAYTPVWTATTTNPTLGNGTLTGAYRWVGMTVDVRIQLTVGSTTTVGSGVYRFSLPVGGKTGSLLAAMFKDASAGTARYSGLVELLGTAATGDNMRVNLDGSTGTFGAALPVVPASGDQLLISGTYEVG